VPTCEEVLLRVLAAGVCHTDLHIIDGAMPHLPLPRVLGHEITGETDELGPVVVYASWGCGECLLCRRGEEQLCPHAAEAGWVRDGGYAEFVLVPSKRYLLPLNGLVDPIRAAPLADAGVTPYRAVRRARDWLRAGDTAVVIGAGGLGQFAIQYLRLLTDVRVVAVDLAAAKRQRALELGADEATEPSELDLRACAVFDFVGADETLELAARVVEPTGLVVVIGEAGGVIPFGLGRVPHEATFTTSIWGSRDDLEAVLRHARAGELDWQVEALPLDDVNDALDRLRSGDVVDRLVVLPDH